MKRPLSLLPLLVVLVGGAAFGYWLGMSRAPGGASVAAAPPDGQGDASGVAAKPTSTPEAEGGRRILYYRNPMGLPDASPVPKKDSMGMDYIPVYAEDEGSEDGSLTISPGRVQKLGVRTEVVERRSLARTVRAVGTVQADERRLAVVTTKFDGFIEKLQVSATGQEVRRGQPLMEVYSPDLVIAQQEYLVAVRTLQDLGGAGVESRAIADRLIEGALAKLRNWDLSSDQIERLRRGGEPLRRIVVPSPAHGTVLEKQAVEGMRFAAGDPLYRLADLSSVWLIADVFEQDVALVRPKQAATVTLTAYPGRRFEGVVDFIYPTLKPETRTVPVRLVLDNRDRALRTDMYAEIAIASAVSKEPALAAPLSAVLDNGARKMVLVEREEGRFEPREVRLGAAADGYYEILSGLREGERVVVSANFLIDAESNLRAALQALSGAGESSR